MTPRGLPKRLPILGSTAAHTNRWATQRFRVGAKKARRDQHGRQRAAKADSATRGV